MISRLTSYSLLTLTCYFRQAYPLVTWNIHYDWGCYSVITNSSLASVSSSVGLTQQVDCEGVGWCTAHSEVSTSSDTARPHPLHSGGTSDSTGNTDITCQSIWLSKCWISTSTDRHHHCKRADVYEQSLLAKRQVQMCQTSGSVWSHQLYTYVNAFLDQLTIARYDHCHWWSSPGILHCAVVCPQNVTLTHWRVNGEHGLVGTHDRIHYSLGLLVGSIEK